MRWESGDRVMILHEGVIEPATVRGGERTEVRDENGAPRGFTESYLVTIDNERGDLFYVDGSAIRGEAP